jgi:hypothetical protein
MILFGPVMLETKMCWLCYEMAPIEFFSVNPAWNPCWSGGNLSGGGGSYISDSAYDCAGVRFFEVR